jgi:DNA-binding XRE family transcriptional regulator
MTATEIKAARLRLNLSQPALAERLGCTTRAVQSWEQGTRNMPETCHRLLATLEPPKPAKAKRIRIGQTFVAGGERFVCADRGNDCYVALVAGKRVVFAAADCRKAEG